jgi:hypothetical protein
MTWTTKSGSPTPLRALIPPALAHAMAFHVHAPAGIQTHKLV